MSQTIKNKKIILIEDCCECIHLDDTTVICRHPEKEKECLRIENILSFPDWCPLEDAKYESEATK